MDFKQAGLEVIHAAKKEGLDHVDALIEGTEELEVQIRDNNCLLYTSPSPRDED